MGMYLIQKIETLYSQEIPSGYTPKDKCANPLYEPPTSQKDLPPAVQEEKELRLGYKR